MKEQMILKTELLSRLGEIYNQLEVLEDILHSSYQYQHKQAYKQQKDRVDHCSNKLSQLEDEIYQSVEEKTNKVFLEKKNMMQKANISLDLCYKGL